MMGCRLITLLASSLVPIGLSIAPALSQSAAQVGRNADLRLSEEAPPILRGPTHRAGDGALRRGELHITLRAPPPPLADDSLRGTVEDAVQSSYRLRAAMLEAKAAETGILRQMAGFLPNVSASATSLRGDNGSVSPHDIGIRTRNTGSVSLTLPLYSGGQTWYGVKSARASAYAARSEALAVRSDVALETVSAYFQYLLAERTVQILDGSAARLEGLLNSVGKRRGAGFASNADVEQVRADLLALRQQVIEARAGREKARAQVESLAGRKVAFRRHFPLLDHHFAARGDELAQIAGQNNPRVVAALHNANAAEFTSRATLGKYLPQLDLTSQFQRRFDSTPANQRDNWSVGFRLSVPLVDVGTIVEYQQRRELALAAQYRAADARRQTEMQARTLWQDVTSGRARLASAAGKSAARRNVVASWEKQYDMGLASLDSLLEKHRALSSAEIEEEQARVQRYFAMCQLLATAGTFEPAMLGY